MLLIPGPVDVPDEVLAASAYVQNHRSEEFRRIVKEDSELLSRFAGAGKTVITTGSGTTAVESMLFSMVAPHEKVLAVSFGEFGNRLIESLKRNGSEVATLGLDHGGYVDKESIEDAVKRDPGLKTLCLVHNETGNGTSIHNLREIADNASSMGMKVLVDSVSGFGSIEIKADQWGIDAIASCSQKGIASVPGLGMISLSEKGIKSVLSEPRVPKYMDLGVSLKFLEKDETPYTPSTGSFKALNVALRILEHEGIEERWKRHSRAASFVRDILSETDCSLYGNEGNYSDTVIAFRPPVPVKEYIAGMKQAGIQVSKGMKEFADSMVRVGLLGVVPSSKIAAFANAHFEILGTERRLGETEVPEGAGFRESILQEAVR